MDQYKTLQTLQAMHHVGLTPTQAFHTVATIMLGTESGRSREGALYNLQSDLVYCVEQAHNGLNSEIASFIAEVLLLAYKTDINALLDD